MKYTHKHNAWFTLIELLVSITIFSIIMVSVISIFIFSANLSAKVDINRSMQENIKNAVETMAEDIRKNGITWISVDAGDACIMPVAGSSITWNKLCTSAHEYTLSDIVLPATFSRNLNPSCTDITTWCSLFQKDPLVWWSPLTNSFVSFRELNFTLTWDNKNQKKVTVNFVIQPAVKKWVRTDLIKNSKIVFQTTLSERLIKSN